MKLYEFKSSEDGTMVEYDNGAFLLRLTTPESPHHDLCAAIQNVLTYALEHYGITGMPVSLRQVSFSYGDNSGTKLILNVSTQTGDYARLVLPKITDNVVVDKNTREPIECPKNRYLEAIAVLSQEIQAFIKGKSDQLILDFYDRDDSDDDAESTVVEFNKAANA